jgi:carboxyl-terminal processing protease
VSAQEGTLPQLDVFSQVLAKIKNDYVDETSMKNAINGAIRGLLEQVDPAAGFLTAKDVAFYQSFGVEKTPGIGVVLVKANGFPTVLSVIPGGPAAKAGIKVFDAIEEIDGVPTREMNLVQAYGYLATPADKPASLVLIGPNRDEPLKLSVPREITKVPPVESRIIQNDIAYVRVPLLMPGKAAEVRKQIDDLTRKGATGVILDLRGSAGGRDTEGFALANLFVDSGTLGYLQGQRTPKKLFTADPRAAATKAPLVVLIDNGTGGATELAAAAIAEAKRGKLVGQRTFGLNTLQQLIPMEGGNALLISTGKYYTASGKDLQETGVQPDTRVPENNRIDLNSAQTLETLQPRTDKRSDAEIQLERAIEVLKDLRPAARRAA